MFSFECKSSKEYGGESKKDTPVPMPNTEVKLQRAESSWGIAPCEDRASPRERKRSAEMQAVFCLLKNNLVFPLSRMYEEGALGWETLPNE